MVSKNTSSDSTQASHKALSGFSFSRAQFESLADAALKQAKKLGATAAAAEASEGCGLSVGVRLGALENLEYNRDKGLSVTVYIGQRRGNASTSDFSEAAIAQTVQAAYDIAKFTAEDPAAGLPDADTLASAADCARDLDLFHPWRLSAEKAQEIALACEAAALSTDARIGNSEGASVSAQQSHFFTAHSNGFRAGYASSRHSMGVAPIAVGQRKVGRKIEPDMQRDAWYTSERKAKDMAAPEAVGRYAAERALSRLNARKPKTGQHAVLFENTLASGLLGSYVQATSGGALYRNTSFLMDSVGKQTLAAHIDIDEDPFVRRGKSSAPFDDEGCAVRARRVLDAGITQGYFLGTYSARKLGLKTTGNAGGSHNLVMRSRLTRPEDDLPEMLKKLHKGVFITEMLGSGLNLVTGDYSRGAVGFWVENGEIAYPIEEFTIAGNMKDMLLGIQAIGSDAYTYGGKTVGTVLLDRMTVAGG
jgi:PmbA protein